MKKVLIYISVIILLIFISIQFISFGSVSNSQTKNTNDLLTATNPPAEIAELIRNGCYDCHSEQTVFPWYSKIAPVSWLLESHISEAREYVNFSDWSTLSTEDQIGLLQSCADEINTDEMPLSSYKIMHKKARFDAKEKELIENWIKTFIENHENLPGQTDEN